MIAKGLQKTEKTLTERGVPEDSYFEIIFSDGSTTTEHETNWSSFSQKKEVEYFGGKRGFMVSSHQIKSIRAVMNGMEIKIEDIPDGCEVYQFIHSQRLFAHGIDKTFHFGRGIGLIKDGSVVEELFINAFENRVEGMKK